METTTCPGCNAKTFVGDRIRHVKGCSVAADRAAVKSYVNPHTSTQGRAKAYASTHEDNATIRAALHADFKNNDK